MNEDDSNGRLNGHYGPSGLAGGPLGEQLPPQNLAAERAVLGAILLDNAVLEDVSRLVTPEDFYRDAHQVLYRAILEVRGKGLPIDAVILADHLERSGQYEAIGGDESLLEIADSVPHAANAAFHAQIVRQKSISRRLIQGATEVIRDSYSNVYTPQQLRASARLKIEAIEALPDEPWPELVLQREPEATPFPADVFPPALERFCRGAAAVTLAPVDLSGAAMLAAAGAAIGQSCNIHLKRTWHEAPLLYLLVVAEPGKSKTPPMKLVVKPLTHLDGELRTKSKLNRLAWEELKKVAKGNQVDAEPPQLRAVVKDITRETLVAILADNPRGVLADPDEATGWVGSFNEYKGKGTDRQFWLDLWSSRAISVDREGGRRSSWVASPFVTVLGGLPPDMLGALGEERGRNDGFHDRLLFVYPSSFPGQEWIEDELDAADEMAWHAVIRKLHAAAMYVDEERQCLRPHLVDFTAAGKRAWVEWYNAHCAEMEAEDAPLWLPGAWSKLRAYAARFALILSRLRLAIDPDLAAGDIRSPVDERDVRGAVRLVEYFKGHIGRVQHRMTGGTGDRDAQAILAWIRRKGVTEFREAELRKDLCRRFPDASSLAAPLRALVDAGVIRPDVTHATPGRRGRKPTPNYEVRPGMEEAQEVPLGAPRIRINRINSPESPF